MKFINDAKVSSILKFHIILSNLIKIFEVINRGPSSISGASLDIIWPSFADNGRHLLYLIDEPQVNDADKVKCRVKQAQNINPDSLTVIFNLFFQHNDRNTSYCVFPGFQIFQFKLYTHFEDFKRTHSNAIGNYL